MMKLEMICRAGEGIENVVKLLKNGGPKLVNVLEEVIQLTWTKDK
jgi:hypothetical protein